MKIVCDNCSQKYQISDDKVQGRVFKIRCKKCSHVIVVRGNEDDVGAGVAAAPGGNDAVWYVVRNGQQDGPYTLDQVGAMVQSGEVTADTFSWREGFGDWVRLAEAEGLSILLQNPAANGLAAAAAVPSYTNFASPMGGPSQDMAAAADHSFHSFGGSSGFEDDDATRVVDQFSEPVLPGSEPHQHDDATQVASAASLGFGGMANGEVPAMAASAAPAGNDGFTGSSLSSLTSNPAMGGGGGLELAGASDPVPSGLVSGMMNANLAAEPMPGPSLSVPTQPQPSNGLPKDDGLGSRNENSVLFSLSSLQAVSASHDDDDEPKNTDASGLIDIRALADSAAAVNKQRAQGPSSAGRDPFGAAAAGPAIAVPAMMPMGTRRSNTPLMIAIGVIALIILLLGAVIAYLLLNRDGESEKIVEKAPPAEVKEDPAGADGSKLAMADKGADKEEEEEEKEDEKEEEEDEKEDEANAEEEEKGEEKEDTAVAKEDEQSPEELAAIQAKKEADALKKAEALKEHEEKMRTDPRYRKDFLAKQERRKDEAEKRKAELERKREEARKRKEANKETKTVAKGGKNGTDAIDDILGGLGKKKDTKKAATTADKPKKAEVPAAEKKKGLSKGEVQGVVRRHYGAVRGCAGSSGDKGTVMVRFTIQPSGGVGGAQVTGKFAGTPAAGCVSRVVRGMRFPRFDGPPLTINYPFVIR